MHTKITLTEGVVGEGRHHLEIISHDKEVRTEFLRRVSNDGILAIGSPEFGEHSYCKRFVPRNRSHHHFFDMPEFEEELVERVEEIATAMGLTLEVKRLTN